jgi:isoquinoline 1-oxidoreductase alpha subunit
MTKITLNGQPMEFRVDPETPLLWVLRDVANLTGTKYGCGIGACGACTVHIDGQAVRSCQIPIGTIEGTVVVTIEGLSPTRNHPVQRAWIEAQVPQCGYCQSGMIMTAAALLARVPNPTETEIADEMTNLCRCGTYPRIKRAIVRAAELGRRSGAPELPGDAAPVAAPELSPPPAADAQSQPAPE